jgi:hypothetical protein
MPPARSRRRCRSCGRDRLDPPRGRRRDRRPRGMRSSPIRSPRACSTAPASRIPATPNFSPSSRRSTPGKPPQPVMMLWSPELAVVPVTIHLPLREAPRAHHRPDRRHRPHRCADLKAASASRGRALRYPASIPHAGEDGALGERTDVVAPAVERCARRHRRARAAAGRHHVPRSGARDLRRARCMYHDQALIPIKTLAFDHAVNVTLGLPFVRTSPDHGTAFDIAGTGRANPVEPDRRACGSPRGWRRRRAGMSAIDDLPPLREVIRARAVGAQIARPEFPARSQPHRADRARRGPLEGVHRDRGRPGSRRADARAAGARRARVIAVERDERALAALERDRRALSRPARDRRRRRAEHSIRGRCSAASARDRRQPALQHRHRPAVSTGSRRAVAALVRHAGADVSARGRRAHRRAPRLEGLWPARGARRLARRGKILFDISPAAFVPPPKVTSSVVRLVPRAFADAAALRPPRARAGRDRARVRPAPQNAAAKPQIAFASAVAVCAIRICTCTTATSALAATRSST